MWDLFLGWGGLGGAHWVKKLFFLVFFSFLMFLAQNQLGKVGEGWGGVSGWSWVGWGGLGGCTLGKKFIFLRFF